MNTNYCYWMASVPNGGDWRTQLAPDFRQKIVDKIMETLKKHLTPGPDDTKELRRIASDFEEKTFNGASNQNVYLLKISMKMLAFENRYQNAAASSSSFIATTYGTSMDSRHLMYNNNNWRPSLPNGEATMDTCDWRTQLLPDTRQYIINKIMETLKKHLTPGPDDTKELGRIAADFEEKTFNGAINQTAYIQKIYSKMLAFEARCQNTAGSSSSVIAATDGSSMDSRHLMDNNNNRRPSLPHVDTCDWILQLLPDPRQNIINKLNGLQSMKSRAKDMKNRTSEEAKEEREPDHMA